MLTVHVEVPDLFPTVLSGNFRLVVTLSWVNMRSELPKNFETIRYIYPANMPRLCRRDKMPILYFCGNKMLTRCNRWFLLHILLLAKHVSGTTMPIIRSSRVLYRWLLPVVFGALVFKLSVWCRAEGCVSDNPQLHTTLTTWKPKYQIPQAATTCIILSSSWWWA